MKRNLIIIGLICLLAPLAHAQGLEQYQNRQSDLTNLAGIFGELHHLRRTCEPRFEADVWRDRMKKLLDLEEPQATDREEMIAAFKNGYRDAHRRYRGCARRARDYAASRASDGDIIVRRLTAQLRQDEGPELVVGPRPY